MELLSINTWWASMSTLLQVYWAIAFIASVIFVIQIVMTFIGVDSDSELDAMGDADASIDEDSGIGFQLISLKNLVGFFAIFGWSGIACLDSDVSVGGTIIISFICGLLMMVIMATIFFFMGKLVESGNVVMSNAIGKTATVYLTIPAARRGTGKIQIQHQGFRTLDALTDNIDDIQTGAIVKVTDVVNDELLVVDTVK